MKQAKRILLERSEKSIMKEFAMRLNVTPKQIMEHNKSSQICHIRYLYCKLRHEIHGVSYSATGREIGRDNTTVRYGILRINNLLSKNDPKMMEIWNTVKDISATYIANTN